MGQYFLIVNVTKKEYVHPHNFGNGLKLGEQSTSINIFNMLMIDKKPTEIFSIFMNKYDRYLFYVFPSNLLGSWKDDEIVFAGDYSEKNEYFKMCTENDEKDENDKNNEFLNKNSYFNIINYFVDVDNKKLLYRFNFVSVKDKYYYYNTEKKECYVSGDEHNYILYLISDHEDNKYSWDSNKLVVSETEISGHSDYSVIDISEEPF